MKLAIKKKMIIGGFGLGLFILSGVSIISYWSLIGVHPATSLPNPMLTVALGNSLSLMILGWVYFLYSSLITRKCPFYEATGEADAIDCIAHDITARKRAELEQERFFNLSLDMLVIANHDGYFTHLNPAWEQTLGFTLEELKAQPFIEFVHPENVEATQAKIEEQKEGICVARFENRYRCKDGSYKWLSWTSVPFLEEGLIYGVARDISDKKQAEAALLKANEELEIRVEERTAYLRQVNDELLAEIVDRTQVELALRKSESLYRTLVETIPHGIEEINTTGIITFGNSALHRMLGYTEGELLGKRIWELIPDSDRITLPGYLAMLVQDQPSPPSYQGQALTKEGKVLDIQVDWDYKRDKQGQVTGFIAVITDITDIRTRKQELQALFEGSLDAIAIVDDQGKYVEVNPAFCQLLGVPHSQILGHQIGNFIESSVDIEQQWRILLQQGQATGELRLRHSDGTLRDVEYTAKACFVPGRHLAVLRDITERKQAQEKIHFQARLLDVVQQAAMVTDLAGNIIYWNRYAEVLYGWSASEVLGRQVLDVTPTETTKEKATEIMSRLQAGESWSGEFWVQRRDGTSFLAMVFDSPIYDEQGEFIGIIGISLDITESKQAQEALRASEELYRTVTSNFPNGGVILFDQNLRYTLAEGKGLATVGLSKELIEGKTIWEALSPETYEVIEPVYRAALDGRETIFETTYNSSVFLVQVLPVKNEQGEVFAGMSMLQDITESKRSKQALLEERNFVSAILDIAAAFILVCDPQGRFIRVNRACEQITGYSIDEIKGKYIWDLFLIPEEVEPVKGLVRELQSGHFPNEYDNYWVMRDGNRRLISWSNTVLLGTDGSVKYIVSIGIDITDRKRTEEIRRALEREQELSELRLRFFSMASHEFRTPLSTILLTAQILESSAHEWSTQKRVRNLRRISSAAKNMTQLLNDILTINRAETGKLEFNLKLIAIENFCQVLLKEIQLNAGSQYNLTFSSQGKCQNALIDERLLRSILTNLLTNAIKYSPDGGEVHLALTCEQEKVSFQVRDQGIGIPLSDQPHLFEAFHRGENIGNIPGSGLGLTVVKKCVDLHGGKISVRSEVGVGTTFTVTLPVS